MAKMKKSNSINNAMAHNTSIPKNGGKDKTILGHAWIKQPQQSEIFWLSLWPAIFLGAKIRNSHLLATTRSRVAKKAAYQFQESRQS